VTTLDRPRTDAHTGRATAGAGPVMLATLEVPFAPAASAFAVDTAVESGLGLVVVNAVELLLAPASVYLGYGDVEPPPEDADALKAPALLAHSLGVHVERLRLRSPRPVAALLDLAAERSPSLLVFGPDASRMRARRYAKAARTIRERAACLVWVP
jgi:nucleotide-binding universal stress UspA family protein